MLFFNGSIWVKFKQTITTIIWRIDTWLKADSFISKLHRYKYIELKDSISNQSQPQAILNIFEHRKTEWTFENTVSHSNWLNIANIS